MPRATRPSESGPFRADHVPPGSRYELSNGHSILCMPTGGRGSRSHLVGGAVLETDPAVESAGVDTGVSPNAKILRAPDVAVGNVPDTPGWMRAAPPLAVEYADTAQDENDLQDRIRDLLANGTRFVWVVRLVGPRRVEVYEPGGAMRVALPGAELTAPGVLQNPVRVEALYDRAAAHEATLRNLLQRQGYESLEAVKQDGEIAATRRMLRRLLERRGLATTPEQAARIEACADLETLQRWHDEAAVASSADEALR